MLEVVGAADSVELKLTVLESTRAVGRQGAGDRCDGCPDPPGLLLRHSQDLDLNSAGVVVRARRRQNEIGDTVVKIRPVDPVDLSMICGPTPSLASRWTPCPGATSARHHSRDRRTTTRSRLSPGEREGTQAVLQSATSVLRGARSRRFGAGRSRDSRPDPHSQGEVPVGGLQAPHGRRAVALSRRVAGDRALDQDQAVRGIPGGVGMAGLPGDRRTSTSRGSSRPRPRPLSSSSPRPDQRPEVEKCW